MIVTGKSVDAMGKRWPPKDAFILKNSATLAKVRSAKEEWIGVYPWPNGPLLGAGRSPGALARRLKRVSLNWPVFVHRAPSRADLPVRIEADKPKSDPFMGQMQQAYGAVGKAWNIVRNSNGLYSEAEVKRARDFLRGLGNACRSEGKPRGDKAQAHENERMLKVFARLAKGETLKQIASDTEGPKDYVKELRSLSVLTRRFSQRVYAAVCSGYGGVSEGFLQPNDRSALLLADFFGIIKQWPGVIHCLEHGYALCEALRRHKPTNDELRRFGQPPGYAVPIGPKTRPQKT